MIDWRRSSPCAAGRQVAAHRTAGERSSAIHTVGGAKKPVTPWACSMGSRLSGVGLAVITLVAPKYTAGPRKTSSCAQWYSGSACSQVAFGHLAFDDAAHVLVEHGVVAQHRALGQRLGAAGVDDLQQVVPPMRQLGRFSLGLASRSARSKCAACRPAGGAVFAGQPEQRSTRCPGPRRHGPARPGRCPPPAASRAGMAQDVGGLVGVEHEVDRHHHRAQARQRKAQRGEAVRVARQDRPPSRRWPRPRRASPAARR
jgi:hypothetical protein